jgi:D-arabinose 1-dehydrogenase-like Zn-dependent alcohol dehydrogenase
MSTHKALILSSFSEPMKLNTVPTPTPQAGQILIRVLATRITTNTRARTTSSTPFSLSLPLTPGVGGIGRVAAAGPDAVSLKAGDLVVIDNFVTARDDPGISMLIGLYDGGAGSPAKKLMDGEWRNGTWSEYVLVPLENAFRLDEGRLVGAGGLGYEIPELAILSQLVLGMSGCVDAGVSAGGTVVIAPATGIFGRAAVQVAVGLGARVIAAARNEGALEEMGKVYGATGRFKSVVLKGDVAADAEAIKTAFPGSDANGIDSYIDVSPTAAANSTHFKSCLMALRPHGKCALIGGVYADVAIPYYILILKSLEVKGRMMHTRETMGRLIKMVESGNIGVGGKAGMKETGTFGLDKIEDAFGHAESHTGWANLTVLTP